MVGKQFQALGEIVVRAWLQRIAESHVAPGQVLHHDDALRPLGVPFGEVAVRRVEPRTVEQVAMGLRPLLDKPVQYVLPTHGPPTDRAAFERALD